jgi:hypothetical protein
MKRGGGQRTRCRRNRPRRPCTGCPPRCTRTWPAPSSAATRGGRMKGPTKADRGCEAESTCAGGGGAAHLYGCAFLLARCRFCAGSEDAAVARRRDGVQRPGTKIEGEHAGLFLHVPHTHAAVQPAADDAGAVAVENGGVHGADVAAQLAHHGPSLRVRGGQRGRL